MHEDIVEHIYHDRGYQAGVKDGMKRAWTLVGELRDFYRDEIDITSEASKEEKLRFKRDIQAQVNALNFARVVIQDGKF